MSLSFRVSLERAEGKPDQLRRLYGIAHERVRDAQVIGWTALEASWQADLVRCAQLLKAAETARKLTC